MILRIVIAEKGSYTHLTLRGSKLIDWYVSMARTRSSSTPARAAAGGLATVATAETPELQLQAVGVEPFAPSPRAYTESRELPPASGNDNEAGVLINSSLADGVQLGARTVVLNSVLVRGTRVGRNAFLNGLMYYDFAVAGSHSAGASSPSEAAATNITKSINTSNTATSDAVIIPANVVLQGFWVHSEALGGAAPGHSRWTKTQSQSQVTLPSGEQSCMRVLAIWGSDDALNMPLGGEWEWGDDSAFTNSFCGQFWSAFQQRTGIRDDDLWPESKVCFTNSCTCIHLVVRI